MKITKCKICNKELKAQATGKHYKKEHDLSLTDKSLYFEYVEYNYPGLIEKVTQDLTTYKYPKTTIQEEKEYIDYSGTVIRIVKLLDLQLDKKLSGELHGKRNKATKLLKYGDPNYNNIEKNKQTTLDRYGVSSVLSLPDIRERIKETNLEKYGNEYGSCEFVDRMGGFAKDKDLASRAGKIGTKHPKNVKHQKEFFASEKFKEWKKQWAMDNPEKATASRLAWARTSKFHQRLKKQFEDNSISTQTEYKVLNYFVDEFDVKTNTCIEFFGDYWHCNPNKYQSNFIHPESKLTAQDIWDRDKIRLERIKSQGYNIFVIWESDNIIDKINEYKQLYILQE